MLLDNINLTVTALNQDQRACANQLK